MMFYKITILFLLSPIRFLFFYKSFMMFSRRRFEVDYPNFEVLSIKLTLCQILIAILTGLSEQFRGQQRASKASWGALQKWLQEREYESMCCSSYFGSKEGRNMTMCVDCWDINKIRVKYHHSIITTQA